MRHESCITSLSWIPSEAVTGGTRMAFDAGFTHYDDPPPGELGDIEALRAADRFRFANVLRAWVEADGSGRVTGCGYSGTGMMGATTVRLGGLHSDSRRSSFRCCAATRNEATGGSGSCRPPGAAPGCQRPGGCGGGRSCSGRRHWCGPH